jgi:UDP-N-acetylmuramoyl-L-alanyl-D-glutamate--2,6-diaminopimelate ligase
MHAMKFSELVNRVKGRVGVVEATAAVDPEVVRVCEDSRKVRAGDLFVARGGTKSDGGRFVADAVARGAVAEISAEGVDVGGSVAVARMQNANLGVALLAHELAENPTAGMKMLAVTGTKGKTTVAYLVRSILRAAGTSCGLVGTVEIDDGKRVVPAEMTTPGAVELVDLFVRMREHGTQACVMEVSSHALHQQRTAGINFGVAMFTNLTGDHLDYHKTMEEYAAAKALLFEGLEARATGVVNVDDAWAQRMVAGCRTSVVRYGVDRPADWSASIEQMTSAGTEMVVTGPRGQEARIRSPLVGKHNVYNTLCAIAGCRAMGVPMEAVVRGLEGMAGVPGRLQAVRGSGEGELPFQVLVDYAHTHDSLKNVLTAVRGTMNSGGGGRLICVFGCGGDRDRTKRPRMALVAQELADLVIVTSDNPRTEQPVAIIDEVCAGFRGEWRTSGRVVVEMDRRTAIQRAVGLAQAGDVVVIAGKGHENYQIIGTTKHHFDDVEEAAAALAARGL